MTCYGEEERRGGRGGGAREGGTECWQCQQVSGRDWPAPRGAPGTRRGRQGFQCGGPELPGGSTARAPEPVSGNGPALPGPAPVRTGQAQRPSSARPPARTLGLVVRFPEAAPHSAPADPGSLPPDGEGVRLWLPGGQPWTTERMRRPSRPAGTPGAGGGAWRTRKRCPDLLAAVYRNALQGRGSPDPLWPFPRGRLQGPVTSSRCPALAASVNQHCPERGRPIEHMSSRAMQRTLTTRMDPVVYNHSPSKLTISSLPSSLMIMNMVSSFRLRDLGSSDLSTDI
ncbi:uncharacterized protein LOC116531366 [Sapajus apella]|uniref:Uncharacterized protein LOC116531366 n=1 Tax=Sapajus apella TaxID=9515 RepID=A0A6J3FK43_SAPAP|nr:uncharacterized protein LOC116531366 [Sapajus apella]